MAKRKKAVEEKVEEKAESADNGGNGKDTSGELDAKDAEPFVSINPLYDAMPNEIQDPGNVFRMAYLDTRIIAITNKRMFLEKHYNEQMSSIKARRDLDLATMDAEIIDAKKQARDQRENIEKQYGISLKSYTYEDTTGVLVKQNLTEGGQ